MIYVMGIMGFFGGFAFGQMVIYFLLRHRTREEILNDPSIKWIYGPLNWLIAAAGAYSFVLMYSQYYG